MGHAQQKGHLSKTWLLQQPTQKSSPSSSERKTPPVTRSLPGWQHLTMSASPHGCASHRSALLCSPPHLPAARHRRGLVSLCSLLLAADLESECTERIRRANCGKLQPCPPSGIRSSALPPPPVRRKKGRAPEFVSPLWKTYICVSPRLLRIMGHPFESSGGTWIWICKTLFAMYFVIWGSYWRQSKSNSKRLTKISSQISLFSHFVK